MLKVSLLFIKDREKEDYTVMREWTYQQFCGRGETREVTDSVCDTRKRYQRTLIPPKAVELTIEEFEGGCGFSCTRINIWFR